MSRGFPSPLLPSLLLVFVTGIGAPDVGAVPGSGAASPAIAPPQSTSSPDLPRLNAAGARGGDGAEPAPAGAVRIHRRTAVAGGWIAAGTRDLPEEAGGGMGLALLVEAADGAVREVAAPAVAASLVHDPEPLLEAGDAGAAASLRGLAWLEGEERGRLAVRHARRQGDGWGEPVTVAPPGPGSQLALSAARLEDGTELLVWSRFDGEDDEIFWSALAPAAAGWSEPRRVEPGPDGMGDRVPDVMPVVAAVQGGAVTAWSGFADGAYRVFVARLDATALPDGTGGGAWSAPQAVGPPGSVLPHFETAGVADAAPPLLLFRTAEPRGWTVVEMDGGGLPRRAARAFHDGAGSPPRPRVIRADGAGVVLEWPPAAEPGGDDGAPRAVRGDSRAGSRVALPWEPLPPAETAAAGTNGKVER